MTTGPIDWYDCNITVHSITGTNNQTLYSALRSHPLWRVKPTIPRSNESKLYDAGRTITDSNSKTLLEETYILEYQDARKSRYPDVMIPGYWDTRIS